MALTKNAHEILRDHFVNQRTSRGVALDATCGNGYDTEFLCSLGFRNVFGFDIQQQAIEATRTRLVTAGYRNFTLIQESHDKLEQFIAEEIECAMFNFGYLPHADKLITTQAQSSVMAVKKAAEILADNGVLSALCYPGHDQGFSETEAVLDYLSSLPQEFQLSKKQSVQATNRTPLLLVLTKTNR